MTDVCLLLFHKSCFYIMIITCAITSLHDEKAIVM